jgi:hypothetical protein
MTMNNWKSGIVALISLIAIATLGSQGGNGTVLAGNELAAQTAGIEQTSCHPRDPLSFCAVEPTLGYPAGELFIVEHFF